MTPREQRKGFWSYARRCRHRSHRFGLRCWRQFISYEYCIRHNGSCWYSCDKADQARIDGPR